MDRRNISIYFNVETLKRAVKKTIAAESEKRQNEK